MTSWPSMITVALCSVSSTRGLLKTPFARSASNSFSKYCCSLLILLLYFQKNERQDIALVRVGPAHLAGAQASPQNLDRHPLQNVSTILPQSPDFMISIASCICSKGSVCVITCFRS